MPKGPQGQKRPADTVANAVWSMDDIVALIDAAEASRQFQTESLPSPRLLSFRRTAPYTVARSLRSSSARDRGDGEQGRGASMSVNQAVLSLPWYRTLSRAQWK